MQISHPLLLIIHFIPIRVCPVQSQQVGIHAVAQGVQSVGQAFQRCNDRIGGLLIGVDFLLHRRLGGLYGLVSRPVADLRELFFRCAQFGRRLQVVGQLPVEVGHGLLKFAGPTGIEPGHKVGQLFCAFFPQLPFLFRRAFGNPR